LDEGGIGSGPGAVHMRRIWAQEAGWVDNWTGGLFVSAGKTYVQVGGISDVFTLANGVYSSDNAAGSTLVRLTTGKYLYTSKNGTTIEFDPTGSNSETSCPGADANTCSIPIAITQPNGLKFAIDWHEEAFLGKNYFRLLSVESSAGYRLVANYVSDSISGGSAPNPNWFKRSSVTFDNAADQPHPLPTITYAYPSASVTEVTDPGNRTWRFTTTAGKLSGIRRPGSASDDITYAYSSAGAVASATKDGITTTYRL